MMVPYVLVIFAEKIIDLKEYQLRLSKISAYGCSRVVIFSKLRSQDKLLKLLKINFQLKVNTDLLISYGESAADYQETLEYFGWIDRIWYWCIETEEIAKLKDLCDEWKNYGIECGIVFCERERSTIIAGEYVEHWIEIKDKKIFWNGQCVSGKGIIGSFSEDGSICFY